VLDSLLKGGRLVPSPEAVARLCELAWYDGLRTGLALGLLAGLVLGYLLARDRR
jgi:hypothetical protein